MKSNKNIAIILLITLSSSSYSFASSNIESLSMELPHKITEPITSKTKKIKKEVNRDKEPFENIKLENLDFKVKNSEKIIPKNKVVNLNPEINKKENTKMDDLKTINLSIDNSIEPMSLNLLSKKIKEVKNISKSKKELSDIIINIDPAYKNATIKNIEDKNLGDFYEVSTNKSEETLYIHQSGEYIIPLILKVDGNIATDIKKIKIKKERKQSLDLMPKYSTVEYSADNEKYNIFVFSDYTCPFCRKLHKSINFLNDNNVTVNYIPLARNGLRDKNTINGLKGIMCSENQAEEYTKAFADHKNYHKDLILSDYNCKIGEVATHNAFVLADKFEVKGTPYIYSSSGTNIRGWRTEAELLKLIQDE